MWYFHNVFRFVFVCSVFWVEIQRYRSSNHHHHRSSSSIHHHHLSRRSGSSRSNRQCVSVEIPPKTRYKRKQNVLENTPHLPGEALWGWRHFRWKDSTMADQGNPFMITYLRSLRVTFHNVTSGQKAPLWRILCNFRLRLRAHKRTLFGTPKGTPFGVSWPLLVAMVLVLLYYILYYYYSSSTKYTGCACVHDHFRFPGRASSGHVTDVTSSHMTSGSTTTTLTLSVPIYYFHIWIRNSTACTRVNQLSCDANHHDVIDIRSDTNYLITDYILYVTSSIYGVVEMMPHIHDTESYRKNKNSPHSCVKRRSHAF